MVPLFPAAAIAASGAPAAGAGGVPPDCVSITPAPTSTVNAPAATAAAVS
jgi:hypothetical protein